MWPGGAQTPGYARARMIDAVRNKGFPEDGVDAAVAARMRRQGILYETDREFEFIIMEVALVVRVCPPGAMLGQLDRLQTASGLENVTLGIVPLAAELSFAPDVGFLIAGDVAYVETPAGERLYRGEEADPYQRLADRLRADAVTGDTARDLVKTASDRARGFLDAQAGAP